jgi:hypothetical protein
VGIVSNELTEAERAVAKIISHSYNYRVEPSRLLGPDEFASEARAIVDAVRPIIEADALYTAADRYLDLYPEDRQYPADLLRTWAAEKHDRIKG